MTYKVLIRKNATGEERWHKTMMDWDEHSDYLWTDGNYACDCNRHLFFERAAGAEPSLDDHGCGDTAYTAVCAELESGEIIPLDGE